MTIGIIVGDLPANPPSIDEIRAKQGIERARSLFTGDRSQPFKQAIRAFTEPGSFAGFLVGAHAYLAEPNAQPPVFRRVEADAGLAAELLGAAEEGPLEESGQATVRGTVFEVRLIAPRAAAKFGQRLHHALARRPYPAPLLSAVLAAGTLGDQSGRAASEILAIGERLNVPRAAELSLDIHAAIEAVRLSQAVPNERGALLCVACALGQGFGGGDEAFKVFWFDYTRTLAAFRTKDAEFLRANKVRSLDATAKKLQTTNPPSHDCWPERVCAAVPSDRIVIEDLRDEEFGLQLVLGPLGLLDGPKLSGQDRIRDVSNAERERIMERLSYLLDLPAGELAATATAFDRAFGGGDGSFGARGAEALRRHTGAELRRLLGVAKAHALPVTLVTCDAWNAQRPT